MPEALRPTHVGRGRARACVQRASPATSTRRLAAPQHLRTPLSAPEHPGALTRTGAASRTGRFRSLSSGGWAASGPAWRTSTPASIWPTWRSRRSGRSTAGCCSRPRLLALTVGVIYLDRDGYRDGDTVGLSLLDSIYYATVTLSTTGYGDITPITPGARLVNILLITPLRIMFLLVLIGTTLEALTARSREEFRIRRWRSRVRQHVIVCGYGTKGRSAIKSLQANGTPLEQIVVVDPEPDRDRGGQLRRPARHRRATPGAPTSSGGRTSSAPAR